MPTVRNRTTQDLNLRIGRVIPALGELDVSDDELEELRGHPLLDGVPDSRHATPPDPAPKTRKPAATSGEGESK